MDKFTSSEKFKQLRLYLTEKGLADKRKINSKEKPVNNVTGIQRITKQQQITTTRSTVVRKSPRNLPNNGRVDTSRLHISGKVNFSNIQSSFKAKNELNEQLRPSKHLETVQKTNGNDRIENNITSANKIEASFLNKFVERDNSGFVKPFAPAPKKNTYINFVEEELKKCISLIQKLNDANLFGEIETAYHFEKTWDSVQKYAHKCISKSNTRLNPIQGAPWNDHIQSWLHSRHQITSSGNSNLCDSRMESSNVPTQNKESTITSSCSTRSSTYILKDWCVVKGSSKGEVMVSGMLIDMLSRELLERNHTSSSIIEKIGHNIVKSVCCTYQLNGNFQDEGLPQEIKKYFRDGMFPDNWKVIVSKWHFLNTNNAITSKKTQLLPSTTVKRTLEDTTVNEVSRVKKKKPNYSEMRIGGLQSKSIIGGFNESLNSSVLTRGAARRANMYQIREGERS